MQDYFFGYPRPDEQVGIRNHVLLLSGTLYANPMCERVAASCRNCIPIVHPLGRCQIAPDLARTFQTLVGHGLNPNAEAVIVADHFKEAGCTDPAGIADGRQDPQAGQATRRRNGLSVTIDVHHVQAVRDRAPRGQLTHRAPARAQRLTHQVRGHPGRRRMASRHRLASLC